MLDEDAPSSRRALEQFRKPAVRGRLLRMARWRTGSEADAEDLVSDSIVRVIDPDDVPWVSDRGTFLQHMNFVMRQVWDRFARKASTQREVLESGLARDETTASSEPSADDELGRRRTVALWRSLVEEVLAEIGDKHPRTRQVYDLGARGIEDPAKQAEMLDCRVEDVYLAIKTLKRHARALLEARDRAEQRRMKELVEMATKGEGEAYP